METTITTVQEAQHMATARRLFAYYAAIIPKEYATDRVIADSKAGHTCILDYFRMTEKRNNLSPDCSLVGEVVD